MHIAPCNGTAVVMVVGASKIYAICLHIFPSGISHSDARIVFFFSSLVNFSLRIKMVTFSFGAYVPFFSFCQKELVCESDFTYCHFLVLVCRRSSRCMSFVLEEKMHSKLLAFRVLVFQFHHNLILSCM